MRPFLPQQIERSMVVLLLVSSLIVSGVYSSQNPPEVANQGQTEGLLCPPCELLFSKLERTGRKDKLVQDIRVQERGEPKSGTSVSYYWASAAPIHACDYLQELYGQESCRIGNVEVTADADLVVEGRNYEGLIFEPSLGSSDSRCSCESVDRVSIVTSSPFKHNLPVNKKCAFSHADKIEVGKKNRDGSPSEPPCTFTDGTIPNTYDDLWRCMHEAKCKITDDWLQMAVFRDPRLVVVSTLYHITIHYRYMPFGTLDEFVRVIPRELPVMCQWLAVRYILFTGVLADQSMEFWYEDVMVDPLAWHYDWFASVGLQLPFGIVEATAQAAVPVNIDFDHKTVDRHPGEKSSAVEGPRRFNDEVSSETLELADGMLRTWLPPVLLERFGVAP